MDFLNAAPPMRPSTVSDREFRILVVDDNPNNLLIASKLSEHLGFRSESVSSGVGALAAIEKERYDIVLMDVHMAPIDGIETSQRIRSGVAGERSRNLYIIAVTAHALDEDRRRCMEAGMDDYVTKPLTLERLNDALKSAAETILSREKAARSKRCTPK